MDEVDIPPECGRYEGAVTASADVTEDGVSSMVIFSKRRLVMAMI